MPGVARPNERVVGLSPTHLRAYGEADDHLRLTALAARLLEERGADPDTSAVCLRRDATWPERRDALEALLTEPAARELELYDIDALPCDGGADLDLEDSTFRFERGELFRLLVRAADRHGWRVHRPVVTQRVSQVLRERGLLVDPAPNEWPELAPELAPIARALCARDGSEKRLRDLGRHAVDLDGGFDAQVIMIADDEVLSLAGRDAAFRVALLRDEQTQNGSVGPLPLDAGALHGLSADGLEELVRLGLLQRTSNGRLGMPRLVREHYLRLAQRTGDIEPADEHRWIASELSSTTAAEAIEVHHHSVKARDPVAALRSGLFYVSDVRELAVRLSRLARTHPSHYRRAARIFEQIVEIDAQDAYAWEYLGYNLWKSIRPHWARPKSPLRERIEEAYERAERLDQQQRGRRNPLYRGRMVGFRAECGADVAEELAAGLSDYSESTIASAWFAHQVLLGMKNGEQVEQLRAARRRHGADRIDAWLRREDAPV